MTEHETSVSIILIATEGATGTEIRRSISSIRSLSDAVSLELALLIPEELGSVDFETESEARVSVYNAGQRNSAINSAFRRTLGKNVLLLDAGVVLVKGGWSDIVEADLHGLLIPEVREIRPIRELTDLDFHELSIGPVGSLAGARALTGDSGFVAALMPRRLFWVLRGLDEVRAPLGASIRDFAERGQRYGLVVDIAVPQIQALRLASRMHALAGARAPEIESGMPIQSSSVLRNLRSTERSAAIDGPLVSIVISTFNRADYLDDCINSILAQTFCDFEVIIVDDGSTDTTERVVSSFSDQRIRYFARENRGISASRNFGTSVSRGEFIVVHDDDDLMFPWRIEKQLEHIEGGYHGNFGVSVHFNNLSGATHNLIHRKFNIQTALRYGHNPTHPTWLIRKDVLENFRYDEELKSGVDNNLALRMVRSGINLKHTGEMLILRRVHDKQITRSAGEIQSNSAKMTRQLLNFANGAATEPNQLSTAGEWLPTDSIRVRDGSIRPWLPDHLVTRVVYVKDRISSERDAEWRRFLSTNKVSVVTIMTEDIESGLTTEMSKITGLSWAGLSELSSIGLNYEVFEHDESRADSLSDLVDQWVLSAIGRTAQVGDGYIVAIYKGMDVDMREVVGGEVAGTLARLEIEGDSVKVYLSKSMSVEDAGPAYYRFGTSPIVPDTLFFLQSSSKPYDEQFVRFLGSKGRS